MAFQADVVNESKKSQLLPKRYLARTRRIPDKSVFWGWGGGIDHRILHGSKTKFAALTWAVSGHCIRLK